jgi:hypothetical protein
VCSGRVEGTFYQLRVPGLLEQLRLLLREHLDAPLQLVDQLCRRTPPEHTLSRTPPPLLAGSSSRRSACLGALLRLRQHALRVRQHRLQLVVVRAQLLVPAT